MRRYTAICAIFLALSGCAVKSREAPSAPVTHGGKLPAGVHAGSSVLLRVTPETLVAGEENPLTFQVVGSDLMPLDLSAHQVALKYRMPSMPQMGIFEATPQAVGPGRFEATLDIVHGGDWRVELTVSRGGAVVDTLTLDYDVKE